MFDIRWQLPDQRLLLALAATLLFVLCFHAEAQQAGTIPRIGYLSNRVKPNNTTPDVFEDAFRQGLHNLGYIEGKNILIDYRYAGGAKSAFQLLWPNSFNLK